MKINVYGLFDIRTPDIIRYVGQTENLAERVRAHKAGKERQTKAWVKSVEDDGGIVGVKILEECDSLNATATEARWIEGACMAINKKRPDTKHLDFRVSPIMTLRDMEVEYIRWAVQFFDGNKVAAAKALGIGRQTLYNKMRHK